MSRTLLLFLAPLLAAPLSAQVTNIAPAGTATQFEIFGGANAGRSIDGNRSGNWFDQSVSHTGNGMNSWWQVDFAGQLYQMSEIRLFPRTDCCTVRNSNFRLSVFQGTTEVWGQDFYAGTGQIPFAGEFVPLPAGTLGDRVRVELNGFNNEGTGWLHLAEVEVDGREVGTSVCGPAQANSTGLPAEVRAVGVDLPNSPFGLIASSLPADEFGFFLVSQDLGSVIPPGSSGVLCLSGNIGRFNGSGLVQTSNPGGSSFGIVVDTGALPVNPVQGVVAGETWHFQAWFRDGSTSNFTDAVSVTF